MLSRQCDRTHTFNRKQVSVGSCGCSSQMVCECNFSKPNPSGLFPLAEQRFLNLPKWYQLRIDFSDFSPACCYMNQFMMKKKKKQKNSESKPLNASTPVLQKWNLARKKSFLSEELFEALILITWCHGCLCGYVNVYARSWEVRPLDSYRRNHKKLSKTRP